MKRWVAPLLFAASVAPAQAMNWEGHDDWMADQPPALEYRAQIPRATPLPPPPCDRDAVTAPSNSYEQVPLGKAACRAIPDTRPALR